MLYVVATPIGNLQDITFRALEVLKTSDFVIAENPKNSGLLLKHFQIDKPFKQFAEHNEQKALPPLILQLKSQNGALITDAGTPGISDPGFRLVRACVEAGIKVVPIPGANAAISALSVSGLPTDRFLFIGFAPRTENKLIKTVLLGKDTESTVIFYESPFRIVKSLEFIQKHFPDCHVVVAREITKVYEEFLRGAPSEILPKLTKENTKGEFTVLISFKK
ncbi:MAG: 16S rRNA (cytidine(1402)-2'-O)-methyltransferase [Candidatus Doudnabacteria bacterium RIFCSPLOWO2_01_FULL_44_21]|uniref:Ribosomal RNA small subunit methyltransferase I n=1 Tax=Candidatus Doudnabacteria bacterium RIFCSPLOWO2_01_FULL_44_21 TaxID=1817841 RepID=A0A1F5Q293_9BACT|nr:MAG: 16S rRNA (cytidine(1402)-2'-O)-methyltransferase [Candidatus Doudnabacteria bacterium RIFCSPHIGHO2_02_FULL_43_13b]OGE96276.1 MAG: 16S rRNA (cytidine(1402)-2'-O)-methyltransferase [Candidatus Doudnabacteria bacterium RIFCSPLOWO2_01_FULL_44_21]